MARLVIGGKTMGFVLVKDPQTRAEAAAMQVKMALEHLADAEPSVDIHERTNNPAETALSSAANNHGAAGGALWQHYETEEGDYKKRAPERSLGPWHMAL